MASEIKIRSDFWGFEVLGYLKALFTGSQVPSPKSLEVDPCNLSKEVGALHITRVPISNKSQV